MTFIEATEFKSKLGYENFISGDLKFHVFIVPQSHDDFIKYLTDIRAYFGRLKDDMSLKYSKDGKFAVYGLFFDGANIVHKKLSTLSP